MKTAFRKLSMQNHPDRNPGNPAAEARFRAVLEAYRILSDPDSRLRYDRQLAWSRMPPEPPPQPENNQEAPSRQRRHHTQHRQTAASPPPAALPPRSLPWKFMAACLAGLVLFFAGLYLFGPKPELPMPGNGEPSANVRELPLNVSPEDEIHFATGGKLTYQAWRNSFAHLQYNESWQLFGTSPTPALFVTLYLAADRRHYRDYVFLPEPDGSLRQVFRYQGGNYRRGTLNRLYFGTDVEPESCGTCEIENLPHPRIAGIYLRETQDGYRFGKATPQHDARIRENLAWLAANSHIHVETLAREYLRQMLTWHFLHHTDFSAETVFREYYTYPDADLRWEEIARFIALYENKIASDVMIRAEAI